MDQMTRESSIEAIYPLSPMQQGMLFETLYHSDRGLYIEQSAYLLTGELDVADFEATWRSMVDRHSVLRTAFVWKQTGKPHQVVFRHAALSLELQDWRDVPKDEHAKQLGRYLREDHERGFDLSRAPVMRLTLAQLNATSWYFIWTHHHLLLDGWSKALVVDEVAHEYRARRQGQRFAHRETRPFRDYIAWVQRQDLEQALAFWRAILQDRAVSTTLPLDGTGRPREQNRTHTAATRVPPNALKALERTMREHRLTLNTAVQGAWALLLSRCSNQARVIFGTPVSGRSADLAGSEQMVGLFINTLPAVVDVPGDAPIVSWLTAMQREQADARQFDFAPLAEIQQYGNTPGPLFESLLVFENYPVPVSWSVDQSLDAWAVASVERVPYPLGTGHRAGRRVQAPVDRGRQPILEGRVEQDSRMAQHHPSGFRGASEGPVGRRADALRGRASPGRRRMERVDADGPRVGDHSGTPWTLGARHA